MSSCKLNHSLTDVLIKLEEQRLFLPNELYVNILQFRTNQLDQQTLNQLFHLLKKYDLAAQEIKEERNESIKRLMIENGASN